MHPLLSYYYIWNTSYLLAIAIIYNLPLWLCNLCMNTWSSIMRVHFLIWSVVFKTYSYRYIYGYLSTNSNIGVFNKCLSIIIIASSCSANYKIINTSGHQGTVQGCKWVGWPRLSGSLASLFGGSRGSYLQTKLSGCDPDF